MNKVSIFFITTIMFLLFTSCGLNQHSEFVILFESNGGSFVQPITESEDTPIIEPNTPTKEGHTFSGWFSDIELENPYEFTTMPNNDLTLYAKWIIIEYTVSYYGMFNNNNETFDFILKPSEEIIKVILGGSHSSAITSEGRVFMWGENSRGQLGDGTVINRLSPVEITSKFNLNDGETIIQISLGGLHSSALTSEGRIFMWGRNYMGGLGDGTMTNRHTPIEITSGFNLTEGEKIVQISLGFHHSSAITSEGRVFTWGSNYMGTIGDGTLNSRDTPTEITSMFDLTEGEKIIQISVCFIHSSAITSEGRLFMWGYEATITLSNDRLQHVTTTPTEITSRFSLIEGEKIIQTSLRGFHSSAITSEGRVFTWGRNNYGQLGDGTTIHEINPLDITDRFNLNGAEKIVQISLGSSHSSAITSEGRVFLWGYNLEGQVGDGTKEERLVPTEIMHYDSLIEGEKLTQISAGYHHSSAITSEGRVFIWGRNDVGQLGDGSTENRLTPTSPAFCYPELLYMATYNINEIVEPYLPVLDSYEFIGWYSDFELTIPYTFTSMPAEDIILFAKIIKIPS